MDRFVIAMRGAPRMVEFDRPNTTPGPSAGTFDQPQVR
jgi:hypothetical protein